MDLVELTKALANETRMDIMRWLREPEAINLFQIRPTTARATTYSFPA